MGYENITSINIIINIINKFRKIAKILKTDEVFKKIVLQLKKHENIAKNKKGNILAGLSTLIVFLFILTAILALNVAIDSNKVNTNSVDSKNFNYMVEDYKRNIQVFGKETLKEVSEKCIETYTPCHDSSEDIKIGLQEKLDVNNEKYLKSQGIYIESTVLSVADGDDPFYINVKTFIKAKKGNLEYENVVESKIAIEGLKDPLPFIMCRNHPTLIENGSKINYKDALNSYLEGKNLENSESYENGTSPLIIKRCPYDPYYLHGENNTLKNCIENGYYHESADGSCYLCRLEGRGRCFHYGLETFIVPNKIKGTMNLKGISSPDHVVFNDHYPGNPIIFYTNGEFNEFLFLDDSHKAKYGL